MVRCCPYCTSTAKMHELMATTLDTVTAEITEIWQQARQRGFQGRPVWPMSESACEGVENFAPKR